MSEFLTYCAHILKITVSDFSDVSAFLRSDFSFITSLFSFSRSFPFFFLCICLTVVGVLALIKSLFSSKNYI